MAYLDKTVVKRLLLFLPILLLPVLRLSAQANGPEADTILFIFEQSPGDEKWILKKAKDDRYLQAHYYRHDTLRWQYPALADTTSWNAFTFRGYRRNGGIENEGLTEHSLEFTRHDTLYRFTEWTSAREEGRTLELLLRIGENETTFPGKTDEKLGSLMIFEEFSDLLPNRYWPE